MYHSNFCTLIGETLGPVGKVSETRPTCNIKTCGSKKGQSRVFVLPFFNVMLLLYNCNSLVSEIIVLTLVPVPVSAHQVRVLLIMVVLMAVVVQVQVQFPSILVKDQAKVCVYIYIDYTGRNI